MKQLLFLLLFPCFAMAQYQGNGNQKITLGEQTTADGLVFRGVENDTALITPFSDTSAYIILDTINNKFYNYNRSTNVWSLAGGGGGGGGTGTVTSITAGTGLTGGTITTSGTLAADTNFLVTRFDTSSMLNNYYRSGSALGIPSSGTLTNATGLPLTTGITGVLPVANGGTNTSTLNQNKVMVGNGTSGVLTPTNLHWDNTNSRLGIGTSSPEVKLQINGDHVGNRGLLYVNGTNYSYVALESPAAGQAGFFFNRTGAAAWINGIEGSNASVSKFYFSEGASLIDGARMTIIAGGNVGIGTSSPSEKLHVVGNARITAVGALGGNSATLYRNSDGVLSTTSSDINKKHNVRPIIYGLSTINQLNPVNFQWNVDESEDIGFIAQDIQNIIPESIETDWDSNLIFKYEKLIPILTKAIQEQTIIIKQLEQRILILENK